jgi:hypothetical protein
MGRVALNFGGSPILYGDQDPTSIGTVVRAGSMDDLLHRLYDYKVNASLKSAPYCVDPLLEEVEVVEETL